MGIRLLAVAAGLAVISTVAAAAGRSPAEICTTVGYLPGTATYQACVGGLGDDVALGRDDPVSARRIVASRPSKGSASSLLDSLPLAALPDSQLRPGLAVPGAAGFPAMARGDGATMIVNGEQVMEFSAGSSNGSAAALAVQAAPSPRTSSPAPQPTPAPSSMPSMIQMPGLAQMSTPGWVFNGSPQ
jgi:hypothetical protein